MFIASYTQASAIAYALGRLYRRAGARTVIGGPHAKAFPADCLRFFDLVVKDCDEALVADILAGRFDPGSVISSARPFAGRADGRGAHAGDPRPRPSYRGIRHGLTTIPMLASMGCPYRCDFCIDGDNAYREMAPERLAADLRYVGRRLPGAPRHVPRPQLRRGLRARLRGARGAAARGTAALPDGVLAHRAAGGPAPAAQGHQLRLRGARHRVVDGLLQQGRGGAPRRASRRWISSSSTSAGSPRTCPTSRPTSSSASTPTPGTSRPT